MLILGMLVIVVIVLGLMVGGVISVTSGGSGAPAAQSAASGAGGTLTPLQIYQQNAAGVVEVRARFSAGPGGDSASGQGLGTGFLVSNDGYILTNAHVVTTDGRDADAVVVVFRSDTKTAPATSRVSAELLGSDENSDIALLRIAPSAAPVLPPLALGDGAAVQVGEPVVAIGNPLGFSFSVSAGIVSATNRNLRSPNGSVIPDGIQTDAAINSGNSGGPLIDSSGAVIGVNTQIITQSGGSQGLGFAVSIDTAKRVMAQLKATGTVMYAYLGVSGQALNEDLAQVLGAGAADGVLVTHVSPGSPAAEAGIRGGDRQVVLQGQPFIVGGDVITAVDGTVVTSPQDLAAIIARHDPGDTVTVTLLSRGETVRTQVTLTAPPRR
jgi:S1-C subfamily serine protease